MSRPNWTKPRRRSFREHHQKPCAGVERDDEWAGVCLAPRVRLYAQRYAARVDLFTGLPLPPAVVQQIELQEAKDERADRTRRNRCLAPVAAPG
jgi:hypothetical protein